jgi:hypothetical protein
LSAFDSKMNFWRNGESWVPPNLEELQASLEAKGAAAESNTFAFPNGLSEIQTAELQKLFLLISKSVEALKNEAKK